nr:hypothetical protein [Tanacetum cinerariifolium]
SSTQANGAQSSRVPVPLPADSYETIRQAYFIGTDTESEPFEGEARTPESPHTVAPPTCHVEESEGSGMSGVRSTSSDSTASLSPNHPLTHTTPILDSILRRTARMVMRVHPVMSPGLSTGMENVAAMSDSAFRKRFRSSYDSSPSSTLLVRKRYRGTSELILGTNSEEDEELEESSDSDSENEDVEDKGPIKDDEDHTVEDEGLAAGVKGLDVDDESYGLNDESRGVDDESHGSDDESYRSERESAFRQLTLTTWTDPEDGMVYIDVLVYPPPAPPVQTLPLPEWTSGSLPISPSPFIVPSLVSSPMISLTVPSHIASPMATSTAILGVDQDKFIEVGAQLELYRGILQDHTQRLDAMPPTLFAEIIKGVRELYTRSGEVRDEIFS